MHRKYQSLHLSPGYGKQVGMKGRNGTAQKLRTVIKGLPRHHFV